MKHKNCGKYFPMNVTGRVMEKSDLDFFRLFRGYLSLKHKYKDSFEVHSFGLHWEIKGHRLRVNLCETPTQCKKSVLQSLIVNQEKTTLKKNPMKYMVD